MALLNDTLEVPAELATALPCVKRTDLFTHQALDFDPRDEEWGSLPVEEQREYLAAKQIIEMQCVAACSTCPLLQQCRDWANTTPVAGVAGGMTEAQRRGVEDVIVEDIVTRDTTDTHATSALNLSRMTEETRAIYLYLAASAAGQASRDSVVEATQHLVDDDTALKWGGKRNGTDEEKKAAGRRKFILNRIDVAVRRGRIVSQKVNGTITLSLPNAVHHSVLSAA